MNRAWHGYMGELSLGKSYDKEASLAFLQVVGAFYRGKVQYIFVLLPFTIFHANLRSYFSALKTPICDGVWKGSKVPSLKLAVRL